MDDFGIDANVVLRAANPASPEHALVTGALATIAERGGRLFITPQVLMEFWSVATRPADVNGFGWPPDVVETEVRRILDTFGRLDDTATSFHLWLYLVTTHQVRGRQVHDAHLVATLLGHEVTHLLTFNVGDFRRYPALVAVHPTEIVNG
jgi:predicted nucleic acid-binding protein